MKTCGTLALAIGLWYAIAFVVAFCIDPSEFHDPTTQGVVVDGVIFAVVGAGLLLVDWLLQRNKQTTPLEE